MRRVLAAIAVASVGACTPPASRVLIIGSDHRFPKAQWASGRHDTFLRSLNALPT